MRRVFGLAKGMVRKSLQRDRSSERSMEAVSRLLWPWRESRLLSLVCFLAVLDYVSTYALLELSGKTHVYEGGSLAGWALRMGGFKGLLLVDVAAVSALLLTAVTIRFLYTRFGFKGFGRTALVLLLAPYAVITMAAVYNNIVLALL